jgi:hypothetical protein
MSDGCNCKCADEKERQKNPAEGNFIKANKQINVYFSSENSFNRAENVASNGPHCRKTNAAPCS